MASSCFSLSKSSLFNILFVVLIFSSFCFFDVYGRGGGGGGGGGIEGQREFDYFALSLQWPGTACRGTKHCCPTNGCCRSSNDPIEFTIHGLWPDYNDGTWPACCSRSKFDMKEISPLLGALEKYWPSYRCGSISSCYGGKGPFWAHEWEKHGTCSSPVVHDEYNYFLTTLNVYFKYNVTRILNEAGYVASNSEKYPLGGIISAIQNAVGATPQITCSHGALEELRICFYKDFKPRDCATGSGTLSEMLASRSSCPRYVSLPDRIPLGLGNVETALLDGEVSEI